MKVAMHGKKQVYEIRIGGFPGQVSNYFDKFADAQMTEHCYYDQSTRAIVRDCKDRITNLGFFEFQESKITFYRGVGLIWTELIRTTVWEKAWN